MSKNAVRRAVTETILSPERSHAPRTRRVEDPHGPRGIGGVLRLLHEPTVVEPLPATLVCLLDRLERAESSDRT